MSPRITQRTLDTIVISGRSVRRSAAVIWLAACAVFLIVLLSQPGMPDESKSALKTLVPLYFLSFPLGHAGLTALVEIKLALYLKGAPMPGIVLEGLFLWMSMSILGYAQWFVLLPWVSRKCRQVADYVVFRS